MHMRCVKLSVFAARTMLSAVITTICGGISQCLFIARRLCVGSTSPQAWAWYSACFAVFTHDFSRLRCVRWSGSSVAGNAGSVPGTFATEVLPF